MVTKITDGIAVSVNTQYQPEYSNPENEQYVFSYNISIRNDSTFAMKLISRKWYIVESTGKRRVVEGKGVLGVQPEIEPGKSHEYESGCHFQKGHGKMYGYYIMERLLDGQRIKIRIPDFVLISPYLLN